MRLAGTAVVALSEAPVSREVSLLRYVGKCISRRYPTGFPEALFAFVDYTEYPVICPMMPGWGAYGKPLKEGKFVKEFSLARWTLNHGAAGGVEFSADPQQGYLIVPDISNNTVWAGIARTAKWWAVWAARRQFHGLHMLSVDNLRLTPTDKAWSARIRDVPEPRRR